MKLYPLKFEEIYKKYLWGGEGFEKLNKVVPGNFAAESWEITCHKDGMSVVANGHLVGMTLAELVAEYKTDLLGKRVGYRDNEFPLMVKFINAKNKLSVQVHPDDEYAMINEGEQGKNEAWVVLDANKDAEIIIGVKEGINKEEFQNAINNNNIEDCLNKIKVQSEDIINIKAGLIHAIGEGILLAEIQQNSNVTYRVYDYNRKDAEGNLRPLHVDKALDVIDFTEKKACKKAKGITVNIGKNSTQTITIVNQYFCLETYDINEEIRQRANGETFLIYIFTEGNGSMRYNDQTINVSKGDTYLIPANLGDFSIKGDLKFIKSYIPEIFSDVINPLVEKGYAKKDIFKKIDGAKQYYKQGGNK